MDDPLAEHSRRITAAPEARINFVPVPGGSRTSRRLMNEVTSSSNLNSGAVRILAPSHEMDHNYLQPDRTRNTRRTLSRHQRNADELDPLQCPPSTSELIHPLGGTSSRLRSSTANETIIQRRTYISSSATSTEGSEIVNGGSSRRIGRLVTEPVRILRRANLFAEDFNSMLISGSLIKSRYRRVESADKWAKGASNGLQRGFGSRRRDEQR